jgi:hypothetical protein
MKLKTPRPRRTLRRAFTLCGWLVELALFSGAGTLLLLAAL